MSVRRMIPLDTANVYKIIQLSKKLVQKYKKEYNEIKDLLNTPYPAHKNLVQDKESVEKIKTFLSATHMLQSISQEQEVAKREFMQLSYVATKK